MKIERVAAYVRVSHQEQKLHGLSLDAQRQKLTEYAETHNLKIVEWYEDEGVSGRKLIKNRPELQRMIHDAEQGRFSRIIFIKLDRFFRSIAEYHECMKIIEPVIWTATEEKYDLSTANGRAFVNMKLTIAELEADQTGERIKLVNDYKVKTGQPLSGSLPFCYKIETYDGRKRIVKNPETQHIMEDLLQHLFTHQSKNMALKYINGKYGLKYGPKTIANLIKNPMLYGTYRDNPNYIAEEERYLNKEDFDRLNDMLIRQVKRNKVHEYIFSGLIRCPECGRILIGGPFVTNKGNKKYRYFKYRCSGRHYRGICGFKKVVGETVLERMMLDEVEDFLIKAKLESAEITESQPVNNELELKELTAELDRLNYSWQKGRIKDVDKYDKEYDELTAKIVELQNKQVEIIAQDFSKAESVLTEGWKDIYNQLDNAHKRVFWRSFIKAIEIEWTTENKQIKKIIFF